MISAYWMLDLFPPYQGGIKGGVRYWILNPAFLVPKFNLETKTDTCYGLNV